MKVLIACEFSGVVRDAFRKKGHDAYSCDLLATGQSYHLQCDVMEIIETRKWDLMIAHPPCTYLCNSGVRWLHSRPERFEKMILASIFFKQLLDASIDKIAVENPIMHSYALDAIGRKYDQKIQPWMFGHGETKATCLWLKNLPPLESTNIVEDRNQRILNMGPSNDRSKIRSITYQGIANAMAEQWGK